MPCTQETAGKEKGRECIVSKTGSGFVDDTSRIQTRLPAGAPPRKIRRRSFSSLDCMPTGSSAYPPSPDKPARSTRRASDDAFAHDTDSDGSDGDDYERQMSLANTALNGGSGGRRGREQGSPLRALTPKRIALIAASVLFLVFWFGKGTGTRAPVYDQDADAGSELIVDDASKSSPPQVQPELEDVPLAKLPPSSPQKLKAKPGSSACTPPTGKKARSYALMIDAGSTGSRLHLYTFSHCDPSPNALPKLEDEGFFTTKPGLSSYAGKPKEAAESLRGLMDHAMDGVPASERACTPVAVKATAGLRLLGDKESTAILQAVESWLKTDFPFSLVEDGVVVMDGRDEGAFSGSGRSSLMTDYVHKLRCIRLDHDQLRAYPSAGERGRELTPPSQLLGLIGPDNADPTSTAAVMDLGGASTQIVFEPTFDAASGNRLAPGDHVYDLDFAGTQHVLYQHSHLGYGLMQARRAVHNLVAFSYVWQSAPKGKAVEWDELTTADRIHNPCLFKGETKVVELDPPGRSKVSVTMVGTGAGFEACRRIVDVMIAKDAVCEEEPCAFAGVYQPGLGEVFAAGKVWACVFYLVCGRTVRADPLCAACRTSTTASRRSDCRRRSACRTCANSRRTSAVEQRARAGHGSRATRRRSTSSRTAPSTASTSRSSTACSASGTSSTTSARSGWAKRSLASSWAGESLSLPSLSGNCANFGLIGRWELRLRCAPRSSPPSMIQG